MDANENESWGDVEFEKNNENCNDQTPLINGKSEVGRLYWYRWYILLQFSMLAWIQTAVAGSWSPINKSAKIAYGFTDSDFDLLVLWGSVGVVVVLPLFMWLITNKGLRLTMLLGCLCVFVGTGLRCIPINGEGKKILIMIGQLVNGFSGAPVCAAASYISNVWFAYEERVLATSIMLQAGGLGGITSYFLGPILIPTNGNSTSNSTVPVAVIRKDIEIYLIIEFVFAAVLLTMVATFSPNRPPTPPTSSAVVSRLSIKKGLLSMLRNKTCLVFTSVALLTISPFYAWTGIMPLLFPQVPQKEFGLIGTMMNVAGIVVGVVIAVIADKIKNRIITIYLILQILVVLTTSYVVIIAMDWFTIPFFQYSYVGLWISLVSMGALNYTLQPIMFEILSDLAFPVSEGTSVFVFIFFCLSYQTIFYLIIKATDLVVGNYIFISSLLATLPLLYFSIPKHNRRADLDSRIQQ